MAIGDMDRRSGGKERNPRVKTRFSLSVENKGADAGRDGRTYFAKPRVGHQPMVHDQSAIIFYCDSHLEPSPSETWFRDMSEEGSFRRV